MRVLAVDPGKVTGWAVYDTVLDRQGQGQLPMLEFLALAEVEVPKADVTVAESYVITAATLRKSRGENWSLEQLGCLRWMARKAEKTFVLQSPSEAKSFCGDEKLRRLGWYTASPGGHGNDASRHLVTYLVRNKLLDPRRLLPLA